MFNFCTYFDQHYLVRGLALYRSLREHCPEFRFWVLCMDGIVYQTLTELKLPGVYPIALEEFERDDEPLKIAKTNRSRIEYYFTCTPSLPLYIFNHWPEVNLITYIDADLFFFSSPVPLFDEMADDSIAIIEHRFSLNLKSREINGIYNVGWLSFKRDNIGFACLKWWRDRCIEWCYDRLENGRFADQKYLDDWPNRFQRVVVLQHKGAGLAPWNVTNYSLCLKNEQVLIDSQHLIFFHFQGLAQIKRWLYDPKLTDYGVSSNSLLKRHIYGCYFRELHNTAHWISSLANKRHIYKGLIRGNSVKVAIKDNIFRRITRKIERAPSVAKRILQGYPWVVLGGRVV